MSLAPPEYEQGHALLECLRGKGAVDLSRPSHSPSFGLTSFNFRALVLNTALLKGVMMRKADDAIYFIMVFELALSRKHA